MRFTVCALVASLAFAGVATAFHAVPRASVSLDDSPETRWIPAIDAVYQLHGWDNTFGAVLAMYEPLMSLLPANTGTLLAANIAKRHPDQYRELLGISSYCNAKGHNMTMPVLSMFFYFYELMHINAFQEDVHAHFARLGQPLPPIWARSCCGILSLPADKNRPIIHGRNMDESPHQGRNMTVSIDIMKGGKRLYQIFDWAWITTGFFTAQRFGGVSLEMNWRDSGDTFTYADIMSRIQNPALFPVAVSFRHVQESAMDFDAAVAYLTSDINVVQYYVIMSGTARRGAILTIDAHANATVTEYLNDSSRVTFKVQTNYDRWLPDPTNDPRRTVAERALTTVGRDRSGTELGVWMALSTWPVHNKGTMYSVLMSADRPDAEGYIRMAMNPHDWN